MLAVGSYHDMGCVTPQWDSSWEVVCPVVYNATLRGGREEKRVRLLIMGMKS